MMMMKLIGDRYKIEAGLQKLCDADSAPSESSQCLYTDDCILQYFIHKCVALCQGIYSFMSYALFAITELPNNELTSIHTLSLPPLLL